MSASATNPWFDDKPGPKIEAMIAKHGEALKERYHTDNAYFALWMHALNRTVQRFAMVSFDDLEDWAYYDSFEAGAMPRDAAIQMLQDNGWGEVLDLESV